MIRTTFRAGVARGAHVEQLVDLERVSAARLTQSRHFSHVRKRVERTAEVGLPALRLVHAVRRTFPCARDYNTRYDTIRDAILTCARKPT